MSNPNIFSNSPRYLTLLTVLCVFPMLTFLVDAAPPAEKKTNQVTPPKKVVPAKKSVQVKKKAEKKKPEEKVKEKPDLSQVAEAAKILSNSKNMLLELRSLKAKIKETIVIGKRRFRSEGEYLQGAERKLRLTLKVKVGDSNDPLKGELLQVCDGQILWARYKIGEQIRLTRRDVGQILKAVEESDSIPENILIAELGLGGIPTLLTSIEQNVAFFKSNLQIIESREYQVIEGEWTEEFRKKFSTDGKPAKKLPAHVPDKIRIYFDKKTNFPRRILYLKKNYKKEIYLPMVMLDFIEVVLNSPVDDSKFNFIPADNESPLDITSNYLKQLKTTKKTK